MKIINWQECNENAKQQLLSRPAMKQNQIVVKKTTKIIQRVQSYGDQALFEYCRELDKVTLQELKVAAPEFEQAEKIVSDDVKSALKMAKQNIEKYHQAQLPKSLSVEITTGVVCERQPRPIERVGLYVPGGTAPLVSTLLMLAIPAKTAGCAQRIVCTPPRLDGSVDPALLVAAKMCQVDAVYKVGGAQAIAAMAFGTQSIPKVDKIFGPGNAWVTEAKQQISNYADAVAIDMPAGPSELMVIADESADTSFVAADLLSQAEHGVDSQVFLVTDSIQFAESVQQELEKQITNLSRTNIVKESLSNGAVILVRDMFQATLVANRYASEHLSLQCQNAAAFVDSIQNAGAVFVGCYAAETLGDYVTGSNHVLPTYGYARNYSGLSVCDFMKFISVQRITRDGLESIGQAAVTLAELEGLTAHANAARLRLQS